MSELERKVQWLLQRDQNAQANERRLAEEVHKLKAEVDGIHREIRQLQKAVKNLLTAQEQAKATPRRRWWA